MSNLPIFLEYDSEAEEQKLVKMFEEKTGRTLYPAQDERLMLSIIEYKASLLVNLFNEAARKNLTQYSSGSILDCIGEMFDTPRLTGEVGGDILKVTLNTTFSNDLTIPKGLEVLSKDENYSFETCNDLVIPAGESEGVVKIKSKELTSAVNSYGIGDINLLVKPVSYIESVTNLNGVTGGADIEEDEAYIKRILLAPERFSCAGSKQSYIYHALSANTNIIDVSAESNVKPAVIKIGNREYTENNGQIVTPEFTANLNRKYGSFNFTLNGVEYTFKMPPDTTVNIYPLTNDDETSQEVLDDVANLLNGDKVNPMTDNIVVNSPCKKEKDIVLNVKLDDEADYDTVCEQINNTINKYKTEMRRKLNSSVVPYQIISKVGSIEGVYSVDTGNLEKETAKINEYFDINFTVNIG